MPSGMGPTPCSSPAAKTTHNDIFGTHCCFPQAQVLSESCSTAAASAVLTWRRSACPITRTRAWRRPAVRAPPACSAPLPMSAWTSTPAGRVVAISGTVAAEDENQVSQVSRQGDANTQKQGQSRRGCSLEQPLPPPENAAAKARAESTRRVQQNPS